MLITKHTRAGKAGKAICCPNCQHVFRVFHFSWTAIRCQKCKSMSDKYRFGLKPA